MYRWFPILSPGMAPLPLFFKTQIHSFKLIKQYYTSCLWPCSGGILRTCLQCMIYRTEEHVQTFLMNHGLWMDYKQQTEAEYPPNVVWRYWVKRNALNITSDLSNKQTGVHWVYTFQTSPKKPHKWKSTITWNNRQMAFD